VNIRFLAVEVEPLSILASRLSKIAVHMPFAAYQTSRRELVYLLADALE
jgi:hypothetical protein